jgi:hypothetical protein
MAGGRAERHAELCVLEALLDLGAQAVVVLDCLRVVGVGGGVGEDEAVAVDEAELAGPGEGQLLLRHGAAVGAS